MLPLLLVLMRLLEPLSFEIVLWDEPAKPQQPLLLLVAQVPGMEQEPLHQVELPVLQFRLAGSCSRELWLL